ncbi:MAG: Zn-ribbon domain-containing OB-fold protein [Rhizomicrobium sp.]
MVQAAYLPDIANLEIPIDAWTKPFWDAAAEHRLLMPSCEDCGRFRWPPGPFCPRCQSQKIRWSCPGSPRIYSFTVMQDAAGADGGQPRLHVPALIEFPEADGVRLLAAVAGCPIAAIGIGSRVTVEWTKAANATVPYFVIA